MNDDTYACINDVHYEDEDPYTTPYGLVGLLYYYVRTTIWLTVIYYFAN